MNIRFKLHGMFYLLADSTSATELGTGSISNTNLHEFVSSSSTLFITFTSNLFFHDDGFEVLYFTADPDTQQQCGETLNATLTPQILMSANLPEKYNSSYSCTSYIQAVDQYYTLAFRLFFLDMDGVKGCMNDKFEILEGLDDNSLNSLYSACTTAEVYEFDDIDSSYGFGAVTITTDSEDTNNYGFYLLYAEVFQGINLTYPEEGEVPFFELAEDFPVGDIGANTSKVVVTSTGPAGLDFTVFHDGNVTSLFDLNQDKSDPSTYYLGTTDLMDYETTTYYNLTVLIVDSTYPGLSALAMFFINLTDVDDNVPVFTNLPANTTVYRSYGAGYHVFTVNATDADITPRYSQTLYRIEAGDKSGLLDVDFLTGEIILARPVSDLDIRITSYVVVIGAWTHSGESSTATLELIIPPDGPPLCTHGTAWADELNRYEAGIGTVLQFGDPWNCTDEYAISYSIGAVSPSLATPLFSMSNVSGEITLLRTFAISEVPGRQFNVSVVATDSMNQTTTFFVVVNVSALICYPKPRQIYVRMDDEVGSVIISDYNCTGSNLTYTITSQNPEGTFGLTGSSLILRSTVYKIRFYSLTMSISDGVDTETLNFKVTIRMKRCPIPTASGGAMASFSVAVLLALFFMYICV